MLLAAGRGQRLAPLSDQRPKPLFPVLNEPMLHYWLQKLADLGMAKVVINAHYLRERIVAYAETVRPEFPSLEIVLSLEDAVLGTGGGLKKARSHFDQPFLVVNSDIHATINLASLAVAHSDDPSAIATVAVLDFPAKATVSVDDAGAVLGFRKPAPLPGERRKLRGAGIMALNPEALDLIPDGPADIIEELQKRIDAGARARAYREATPFEWRDMGTVSEYYSLNASLARGGHFIAPGARLEGESEGFLIAAKGARVHQGAFVKNCVLWENAVVEPGARLESMIVAGRVAAGVRLTGGVAIAP